LTKSTPLQHYIVKEKRKEQKKTATTITEGGKSMFFHIEHRFQGRRERKYTMVTRYRIRKEKREREIAANNSVNSNANSNA